VSAAGGFSLSPCCQWDEAGVRAGESASSEVEGLKVVLEVDVEPFASGGTSLFYREGNQLGSDPASPHARGHNGVQNERVDAPVPRDVDEADELASVAGADPAEAVSVYLSHQSCSAGR
jgi:hypothetical protein